ncbi:MAG TPA: 4-hydroxy-tetrahydrodipicolinate reductase [Clostridiales bacterium]|jgi:4-hydroxy-tetrahydrodipicolinate reductase|nr:4-hydroxy-tetrahydrodipicolinate reductase [Clostridiales bacterium]
MTTQKMTVDKIKIGVVGFGRMGRLIWNKVEESEDMAATLSFDTPAETISDLDRIDVLIDFSHPNNLAIYGPQALAAGVSLVIATTGYAEEQRAEIRRLAEKLPIVFAANCSIGVTVMARVCRDLGRVLGDRWDMEVVEAHHNQKIDAPSGTAKLLVDSLDPDGRLERVYGRFGERRRGQEIGVHAVRGGSIVGEHKVIFAGSNEVLEVTHRAGSRDLFAEGALAAARFVHGRKPGLYTMEDVLYGGD